MVGVGRWVAVFTVAAIGSLSALPSGAQEGPLGQIATLTGRWTGVGEGVPGISAAHRTYTRELGGRFIRADGRSVYPKQDKNAKGEVHDIQSVWSYDKARKLLVLRVFDSLGFVSTYVQDREASSTDVVVLESQQLENAPAGWRARYTYSLVSQDEFRELFELDPDGKGFRPYVTGRFLRVSPAN
jgi:hypothetical protein